MAYIHNFKRSIHLEIAKWNSEYWSCLVVDTKRNWWWAIKLYDNVTFQKKVLTNGYILKMELASSAYESII